KEL
ncbi:hypothetical protein D039_2380B, partial [Vibrio parahaemolyticus EKP-028]